MPPRTRVRNLAYPAGNTIIRNGSGVVVSNISDATHLRWAEQCQDVIGNNGGENPFRLTRIERMGGVINGTKPSGLGTTTYNNVKAESISTVYANPLTLPWPDVNMVYSRTGPLTPKVNVPLFLFELKDVPRMLKHAGDLLHKIKDPSGLSPAKEGAAATLAFQFGWKPLVEDLIKLTDFVEIIERKQEELDKAGTSKGLRRKLKLGFETAESVRANVAVSSITGTIFRRNITVRSTIERWATVRWKAKAGQGLSIKTSYSVALRAALGLNPGMIPISIWKAMPWSWLIDWFVDVSSFITTKYNSLYYHPSALSIMTRTIHSWAWGGGTAFNGSVVLGGFECRSIVKERAAGSQPTVIPTARLPYLDSFKLSILGSLTILKLSR